ncbi:unnamed protein product [Triticum turgidum subsp. durum]|uniref:F-box domain-containing protein n=1 Tax=Triticum turgidum subsp. durum TaxID=4567 RepID=A0A9R0SK38_TRITD|nr:unnamed protein product [Triticum turgidum subsp. durum]
MESPPPHKRNVRRDDDRISALPDDLLLGILERLELREAVRAGAVSTRWRHLPHRLSRLHLNGRHFRCTTLLEFMDAFTGATRRLLTDRDCHCNGSHAIKSISLRFFLSAPHLSPIGRAVEHVVSRGETKRLHFGTCSPYKRNTALQLAEFGQQFMSFSRDYPLAFQWLTRLTLKNLAFGHSDVTDLINACDRLTHLTLSFCQLVDEHTPLKIDTPCSGIKDLEFIQFGCTQIELISVPKLSKVQCTSWRLANPPVRFVYVPELRDIWIQPEHPKQLTAIFRNLSDLSLSEIFPECDLSWTLFILEAAPALQKFTLSRTRHACDIAFEDNAEKTNVVWEPSKDFKHMNLKSLTIDGFEEEDKVTNYIRLVMGRAVGLKRIELRGEGCKKCDAIDPRTSQVDETRRHRIKELLTNGSSSSVERIMR